MVRNGVMIGWVVLGSLIPALGEDLSRQPPPLYEEVLAPLLTPLEDVLARGEAAPEGEEDTVALLSEVIVHVGTDGRRVSVRHEVFKARTEDGARWLEWKSHECPDRRTRPHLVRAQTIAPDGRRHAVDPGNITLGESGRGTVMIEYPDLEAGGLTEVILVLEDTEEWRGPAFEESFAWEERWPVARQRRVLDLPEDLHARMREHAVGEVAAKRTELEASPGRRRTAWELENIAGWWSEPSRAPVAQVGPLTYLSSWKDWEELCAWWSGELAQRAGLGEELRAEAARWCAGVEDPARLVEILFRKVANEVRLDGSAFGEGRLQPDRGDSVWERKSGNSLDQAHLLASLLREQGLEASLALVNSRHAGTVHRTIPALGQFDHVLVAASLGSGADERLLFCDPSLAFGEPGALSPAAADREVLVVREGKPRWRRSPAQEAGEIAYEFDLAADRNGRLSGWFTLRVRGYYRFSHRMSYDGSTRSDACARLTGNLAGFFDEAEVVDVQLPDRAALEGEQFEVRGFVTAGPVAPDHAGRFTLRFPVADHLIQSFGDGAERDTSFFQWRDSLRVVARIRLPDGAAVGELPKPLAEETEPFRAAARWSIDPPGRRLESELVVACRQSLLAPAAVARAAEAHRNLSAWREAPLVVQVEPAADPAAPEKSMPRLLHGAGQLALVDNWFPPASDPDRRRAALHEVRAMFPDDPETIFTVRRELAYLLYSGDELNAAAKAYLALTAERPEEIDPENYGLARYMAAICLAELDRAAEAVPIVVELLEDETFSDYRRGWSATMAGEWSEEGGGDGATGYFRRALTFDGRGEFKGRALAGLVGALEREEEIEDAAAALREHLSDASYYTRDELTQVRQLPAGRALIDILQAARDGLDEDDARRPLIAEFREEVQAELDARVLYVRLRAELLQALASFEGAYFRQGEVAPGLENREEFEAHLDESRDVKPDDWFAHAAEYFRRFEPGARFPEFLWILLYHVEWKERGELDHEPLFPVVAGLADRLPRHSSYYWECRFALATYHEQRGRWTEALHIYEAMEEDPAFDSEFEHSAWHFRGVALEALGRWEEAIACYLKFKHEVGSYDTVVRHVLRAGVLQAVQGDHDAALATWELLREVPPSVYQEDELIVEIGEVLAMIDAPEATRDLWERTGRWWRESFLPLCRKVGAEIEEAPPLVLTGEEIGVLNAALEAAQAAGDPAALTAAVQPVALQARILPSQLNLLYEVLYRYVRTGDAERRAAWERCLLEFAIAVEGEVGDPGHLRQARRIRIAMSLDSGLIDDALREARVELERIDRELDPGHYELVVYLYGFSALRSLEEEDMEIAFERLKALCETEMRFADRARGVGGVVGLAEALGREREAIPFLEAQLARPEAAANPQLAQTLQAHLAGLRAGIVAGDEFRAAVAEWIEIHKPEWFDEIEPLVFGPAELEEVRHGLGEVLSSRHELERFKLALLAARSGHLDPVVAEDLFLDAIEFYAEDTNSWRRYAATILGVLNENRFPETMRAKFAWKQAVELAFAGRDAEFRRVVEHPVWGSLQDRYREQGREELGATAEAIGSGDPDRILGAMETIGARGPLDKVSHGAVTILYTSLLKVGGAESSKAARALVRDWKFQPETGVKGFALRLQWSSLARKARAVTDFHDAMAADFLPLLQHHAAKADASWRDRIDFKHFDDLDNEQRLAHLAVRLVEGVGEARSDPWAWVRDPSLWMEDENGELAPEQVKKGLRIVMEETDDEIGQIEAVRGLLNRDLPPGLRAEVAEILEPWRHPRRHPLLYCNIRELELWDYRPGVEIETEGFEEAGRKAEILKAFPVRYRLLALRANGDYEALDRALDTLDDDLRYSPILLPDLLMILRELERPGELQDVEAEAERALHYFVLEAWRRPSSFAARQALVLAARLERPDLLPPGWRDHLRTSFPDPELQSVVNALLALALEDWKNLELEARAQLAVPDAREVATALLGLALHHQGKAGEARPHLRAALAVKPWERPWGLDGERLLEKVADGPDAP